ncbi:MAG: metallopeptidase TldD-related protein [Elusimicrobiota bacterium]|nr:metallopeptidase TldD-related protein [Elusimicrobiota bacterium]
MTRKDLPHLCLELLKKYGAQKAQCVLTKTKKYQVKASAGRLSLLRSAVNADIRLLAIKEGQQGQVSINATGKSEITEAAKQAVQAAAASPRDTAYGISEFQQEQSFSRGDEKPDLDGMCARMSEFLRGAKTYPGLRLAEAALSFTFEEKIFVNSNRVGLSSSIGVYDLSLDFSSIAGGSSSSVNFASLRLANLSRPLMACGSIELLLKQSVESVRAKPVNRKFLGDIIVSPECLGSFLSFITEDSLRDSRIISGTSMYRDKIGSVVAAKGFTLGSMPLLPEIASGYFITPDGYKAENISILESGRLKTFILSRYGAQKTSLNRAANSGGCYVVDPGSEDFADVVKSVKRGLLVTRFSGGAPSQAGDFSGLAKNSFYIENGKIRFPVSETMISGNIPKMFMNIKCISKERVNLGDAIYPWIHFPGVTISGK